MTDRDQFAAAALTGLLMNGDYSTDSIPSLAYSMADAMLRERNGAVSARETDGRVYARRGCTSVPHDRPTFDQIMHALKTSGEAGDILCTHAAEEIERLTLTNDEREAIREAVGAYNDNDDDEECAKIAATLHGLLKRLA